jgi:hypothetical protein
MKPKSVILNQAQELQKILRQIPEDRQSIASDLIEEIVFMSETLGRLKTEIRQNGVTDDFVQGKQQFIRENPALKSYNTTIQRYGAMYKQLVDMLPKVQIAADDDGWDGFEQDRED